MTPDQLTQVLETAVRAPSVHNTQPWLFEVDGDTLQVRADRSRQLPLEDPLGRELVLSCGGAAVHAQLAVRGLGLNCELRWAPTPDDPDHVASLTVSTPSPTTASEQRLLDAVALRHTDRTAFAATPVPAELIVELSAAAQQDGAHLAAEQQPDRVLAIDVLVAHADQVLRQDPGQRAELGSWVRPGNHPAEGVPGGALPDHGRDRGSSLTLRDFEPDDDTGPAPLDPPVAEHPLLVVLSTDGDRPEDWARAGGALARVLLTATAAGLVANPQTQVLEVPGLRSRLVTELGLVGRPQMVLRLGYPTGAGSPSTGRRPVAHVLTAPAGAGRS
jgi:nitroreductase